MNIRIFNFRSLAIVAALFVSVTASAADEPAPAATAAAAAAPALETSNKWRIDLSGGHAAEDGSVQFRVTPKDGTPILVTTKIQRGRGEFFIAKDLLEAFKKQLPMERFKSEIVASQQVLVKPRPGEPDFSLEVVESAVPGMRFHLSHG